VKLLIEKPLVSSTIRAVEALEMDMPLLSVKAGALAGDWELN